MVRTAGFKVQNKTDASSLATELNSDNLDYALMRKMQNCLHTGNSTSRQFINAIDMMARSVPHTNKAARKARHEGECYQHAFGMSSLFLTPVYI